MARWSMAAVRPAIGGGGPRGLKATALGLGALLCALAPGAAAAQSPEAAGAIPVERVAALVPELEARVRKGMADFDVPGVVLGIMAGDRLVYSGAFGVRAKSDPRPVDARTVFQIGSTTKAFLATTLAIAADRHWLRWDDRVVDHAPDFALKDAWVTREFRVFDLLAQRSGLHPYANDVLTALGFGPEALVGSLRRAEPVSSFRSTFAYTNITHLAAGHMVARLGDAADWSALAKREILDPLGMASTSFTAEAIAAAPDHATGHRYEPSGAVEIPFDPSFPYVLGPAGNLNSTLDDVARWLRFQMAGGVHEGRRLVSADNLAVTRMARVAISDTTSYAMGWVLTSTPHGRIIWHNGGTIGFGAHIGFLPDRGIGVIVLSNGQNMGLPDALAMGIYDRLLGNPEEDHAAKALARARTEAAEEAARYRRPAAPRPAGDLAGLVGTYVNPAIGAANVRAETDRLVLKVAATGAELAFEPFDGLLFTTRILPDGRFAGVVAMAGGTPTGFAQFEADGDGRYTSLVWLAEGQTFRFTRRENR